MDTDSTIRNTAPCSICGKSDYEWGQFGTAYYAGFKSDEKKGWARLFNDDLQSVARRCRTCGNLQLFVNDPGS